MILGLPVNTFVWVFGLQIIAIILSVIYGFTFKDNDTWWTIDNLYAPRKENSEEHE